jgi:O-methyltransferase
LSKLDDKAQRNLLTAWSIHSCYARKPASTQLTDKGELYPWIVEHLGAGTIISYLEFGVAHGDSIRYFSERFVHPDSRFIGFDSFEGLPEAWLHIPKSHFSRNGVPPNLSDERVRLVKGWFQNTVPSFLADWDRPSGTAFVHYDADLYGSTLFALTILFSKLPEYYFMMDDFTHDDSVALFDFESAYPVELTFIAQAGKDGLGRFIPAWIFGKIKNIEYMPPAE